MYVPYSELAANSKVWIYQSDRPFTSSELQLIDKKLISFCENWTAHNIPLKSSYQLHHWFICLFVEEQVQAASGCSIDTSVEFIKILSKEINIDFFNRMNIAFLENELVQVKPLNVLKPQFSEEMIVFNNLVSTKSEYESQWQIPLKESWLARYL